jgi:hypothetical protein
MSGSDSGSQRALQRPRRLVLAFEQPRELLRGCADRSVMSRTKPAKHRGAPPPVSSSFVAR